MVRILGFILLFKSLGVDIARIYVNRHALAEIVKAGLKIGGKYDLKEWTNARFLAEESKKIMMDIPLKPRPFYVILWSAYFPSYELTDIFPRFSAFDFLFSCFYCVRYSSFSFVFKVHSVLPASNPTQACLDDATPTTARSPPTLSM